MKRAETNAEARTQVEEIGTMDSSTLMNELCGLIPVDNYRHRFHHLACAIYVELNHRLTLLGQSQERKLLEGLNIHEWKAACEDHRHRSEEFERKLSKPDEIEGRTILEWSLAASLHRERAEALAREFEACIVKRDAFWKQLRDHHITPNPNYNKKS